MTRRPVFGNSEVSAVKCAPVPHEEMLGSVGGTESSEIHYLRHGEKLFKGRIELCHGQHLEDPAAPIVDQHDRQAALQLRPQ